MQYTGTIEQIQVKLKFIDLDKTKIYDINITEHKNKRSTNCNSYAWTLLNQLSDKMNIPSIEIYKNYVHDLSIYKEITINDDAVDTFIKSWAMNGIAWLCEKVDKADIEGYSILHAYYGSSVYNTRQMTRLIGLIEQDCKAIGIETLEEKKLKQLLEDWERNKR
jgi:hypothetical protein